MKPTNLTIKYPPANPDEGRDKQIIKQKQFLVEYIEDGLKTNKVVTVSKADMFPFFLNNIMPDTKAITKLFYDRKIDAKQTRDGFVFARIQMRKAS
jgi:hypothetical protein